MTRRRLSGRPRVAIYTDSWVENVFRKVTAAIDASSGRPPPVFADYGPLPDFPETSAAVPPWTGRVDGALVNVATAGDPHALADWLRRSDVPVVSLNSELLGTGIPTVCADFEELGRLAAEHLAGQCGCRSFVHAGRQGWLSIASREAGFRRALAAFGYGMETFRTASKIASNSSGPPHIAEPDIAALLRSLPKPIGVFTSIDDLSAGIVRLCGTLGLRVPADVAVLGVANSMLAHAHHPTLSSIHVADAEVGRRGIFLLQALIRGENPPADAILVGDHRLYARESTVGPQEDFNVLTVDVAMERIKAHAAGGLTVRNLVRMLRVPERSLRQLFHDELDSSPNAEIQRVRFEHAARLLKHTTLPVGRIAETVGFGSLAAFSTFFRRTIGTPPQQYRLRSATARNSSRRNS